VQGQIYVSEYFNNVIRKITPDGTVTTFAGKPGKGGFADGNVGRRCFYTHKPCRSLRWQLDRGRYRQ
jgi:hypothetical protein